MSTFLVTADAAKADLAARAASTDVSVTPIPADDIDNVEGVGVVVSTADANDPDVVLADVLVDTANAQGEVSFMLFPSGSIVSNPSSSTPGMEYRIGWADGESVTFEMPSRNIRLRERITGVGRTTLNGVRPSQLSATNTVTDGQAPTKAAGLDQFTWDDVGEDATPLSDDDPEAPGTASAGTSTDASRGDHVHPKQTIIDADIPASIARDTEVAAAVGGANLPTLASSSRGQFLRQAPDGETWDMETVAIPARAGAFTAADETKLDGIEAGAQVNKDDYDVVNNVIDVQGSIVVQRNNSTEKVVIKFGKEADLGRIPSAPGQSDSNKVWKTDGSGNPGWRDDTAGGGGSSGSTATGYNVGASLSFAAVTTDTNVANNNAWEVALLSQQFAGGISAGVDFWSIYGGYLYLDVDTATNYDIYLEVEHAITVGATTTSFTSRRTIRERIGSNAEFTLPLDAFSSVSVVNVGEFTDANGNTVTLTQAMLDAATTITIRLGVQRTNNQSFVLESASLDKGTARFFQFATAGFRPRQDAIDLLVGDTGGDIDFTRHGAGDTADLRGSIRADAVGATEIDNTLLATINRAPSIPGGSDSNKVWKTDGSGNPGWRDDATTAGGGGEANVQSDWDVTDTTSDAFIRNKPTDAQIGDKAFSNPPTDLSTAEQTAVRTAIGAGTGSGGGSFVPSAANLYSAVLSLLEAGTNITIAGDGTDEITITAPGNGLLLETGSKFLLEVG